MRKPLIGITCGRYSDPKGEAVVGTRPAYTQSIEQAGGIPILIPPDLEQDALRDLYARVDGLIIAGGGDVDPARYGMAADGMAQDVDPKRDSTEITMIRWAAANDKPLLGICRGCQVANVALGGTLYRDIVAEYPNKLIDHDLWGKHPRTHLGHVVTVQADSRLAAALGDDAPDMPLEVNSLHHQALRDLAPKLVVSAVSPDGLIEGIELPTARFFIGVQWHPEELTIENGHADISHAMRHLFHTFVQAASQRQS